MEWVSPKCNLQEEFRLLTDIKSNLTDTVLLTVSSQLPDGKTYLWRASSEINFCRKMFLLTM